MRSDSAAWACATRASSRNDSIEKKPWICPQNRVSVVGTPAAMRMVAPPVVGLHVVALEVRAVPCDHGITIAELAERSGLRPGHLNHV